MSVANWHSAMFSACNRLMRMGKACIAREKEQPLYCWYGPQLPEYTVVHGTRALPRKAVARGQNTPGRRHLICPAMRGCRYSAIGVHPPATSASPTSATTTPGRSSEPALEGASVARRTGRYGARSKGASVELRRRWE